jgi:hypothetical protein
MTTTPPDAELTDALVRQVVQTGLGLFSIAELLVDALPDDAFPGEENVDVVLEVLATAVAPIAQAAGRPVVEAAIGFLRAVHERTEADLGAALVLEHERRAGRPAGRSGGGVDGVDEASAEAGSSA